MQLFPGVLTHHIVASVKLFVNRQLFVRLCVLAHSSCTISLKFQSVTILFMLHFFRIAFFLYFATSKVYFSGVALFSCCTFFLLHSFHVALYPCCSILVLRFLHVALFLYHTFFVFHYVFHFPFFYLCCIFFLFHFFRVALLLCCTFFMYFFHVTLFPCCFFFHIALITCDTIFMLSFFRIALFSCCFFCVAHFYVTLFSVLDFFHVAWPQVKFFQSRFSEQKWRLFYGLCNLCNLEILLNDLPQDSSICFFFKCDSDRCIVIGVKIDDKNEVDDKSLVTLSKASLNQHFLKFFGK